MPLRSSTMPPGSKLWLLDLGSLNSDAAEVLSGANTFPVSAPAQIHERRNLVMIAGLLHHPSVGLILFDTGSCEDVIKSWGTKSLECTPRIWDKTKHGLPEAIAATGAGTIKDVKAVVVGHLHADHAGGLEWFLGTDTEIWVHETELRSAFWAAATGIDRALYHPEYLQIDSLNWKTFNSPSFELFQGVTLHLCPGHTEGLVIMEVELENSGTVILTSDLFHVKENWEIGRPQGTLMRDFNAWHRSREFVKNLVRKTNARICLGHEPSYFEAFKKSPEYES